MNKRILVAATLVVTVLIGFGGLYASNMGFKLNLLLVSKAVGVSATGLQDVALPYNPQTSLTHASDLFADINTTAGLAGCNANTNPSGCAAKVIGRFVRSNDTLQAYQGLSTDVPNDFPLNGVEGLRIQLEVGKPNVNYIIVGSHDPGRVINLDALGTNGSATGLQDFSFPYHGTATTASDIFDEINTAAGLAGCNPNTIPSPCAANIIGRFVRSNDTLIGYGGRSTDAPNDFVLSPGEAYRIQVNQDVAYVPSHY